VTPSEIREEIKVYKRCIELLEEKLEQIEYQEVEDGSGNIHREDVG